MQYSLRSVVEKNKRPHSSTSLKVHENEDEYVKRCRHDLSPSSSSSSASSSSTRTPTSVSSSSSSSSSSTTSSSSCFSSSIQIQKKSSSSSEPFLFLPRLAATTTMKRDDLSKLLDTPLTISQLQTKESRLVLDKWIFESNFQLTNFEIGSSTTSSSAALAGSKNFNTLFYYCSMVLVELCCRAYDSYPMDMSHFSFLLNSCKSEQLCEPMLSNESWEKHWIQYPNRSILVPVHAMSNIRVLPSNSCGKYNIESKIEVLKMKALYQFLNDFNALWSTSIPFFKTLSKKSNCYIPEGAVLFEGQGPYSISNDIMTCLADLKSGDIVVRKRPTNVTWQPSMACSLSHLGGHPVVEEVIVCIYYFGTFSNVLGYPMMNIHPSTSFEQEILLQPGLFLKYRSTTVIHNAKYTHYESVSRSYTVTCKKLKLVQFDVADSAYTLDSTIQSSAKKDIPSSSPPTSSSSLLPLQDENIKLGDIMLISPSLLMSTLEKSHLVQVIKIYEKKGVKKIQVQMIINENKESSSSSSSSISFNRKWVFSFFKGQWIEVLPRNQIPGKNWWNGRVLTGQAANKAWTIQTIIPPAHDQV